MILDAYERSTCTGIFMLYVYGETLSVLWMIRMEIILGAFRTARLDFGHLFLKMLNYQVHLQWYLSDNKINWKICDFHDCMGHFPGCTKLENILFFRGTSPGQRKWRAVNISYSAMTSGRPLVDFILRRIFTILIFLIACRSTHSCEMSKFVAVITKHAFGRVTRIFSSVTNVATGITSNIGLQHTFLNTLCQNYENKEGFWDRLLFPCKSDILTTIQVHREQHFLMNPF